MIDFNVRNETCYIQVADNKFGWSRIEENTGLCTIPDSGYLNWKEFKPQFEQIIKHTPNNI